MKQNKKSTTKMTLHSRETSADGVAAVTPKNARLIREAAVAYCLKLFRRECARNTKGARR